MSARSIAIVAKSLIHDPENWTQGADARDMLGTPVDPTHDSAVSFCLNSALTYASKILDATMGQQCEAFNTVSEVIGSGFIYRWNDAPSRTHEQVIKALDATIRQLTYV